MLRVLAVLAALTVVGGVLRFHAASDPSAYQSKDEQSYAMIARGLSVTGNYGNPGMTDPVHWPPGAPLMFALAYELKPQKRGGGVWDVPSAYPAQALVGTLTIPAAFLLAYLVAGWGAGLLAAAAVAFYPPLISASGDLLSEPLGALLVTSALAATVWALRRPASWLPPIAAGLLLGATILTRADLALVPAIALVVVAVAAWRRASSRPLAAAVRAAGPMLVALLVILTPWTVFASSKAGHFVPLSSGGGSNLWVGTYLPGNGSMFGAKRALADEVRARNPDLAGKKWFQLRQADVIATVAARHPDLSTDAALQKEGMQNLSDYALGDPRLLRGDGSAQGVAALGRLHARHVPQPAHAGHGVPPVPRGVRCRRSRRGVRRDAGRGGDVAARRGAALRVGHQRAARLRGAPQPVRHADRRGDGRRGRVPRSGPVAGTTRSVTRARGRRAGRR